MDISKLSGKEKEGHFSMSDSVLSDFVNSQTNKVFVKEADTGRYILSNIYASKMFASDDPEVLIGQTIFDLDKFICPHWDDGFAQGIADLDKLAINEAKLTMRECDIFLDAYNHLCIHDMVKMPLIGSSGKVSSIITIMTDRLPKIDLFYLFELYKTRYDDKAVGLQQFVKLLGIADLLCEDLTEREITCLLHMRINPTYKDVANKLNLGLKTIETHVSHIIKKIKHGQLSLVLSVMRSKNFV